MNGDGEPNRREPAESADEPHRTTQRPEPPRRDADPDGSESTANRPTETMTDDTSQSSRTESRPNRAGDRDGSRTRRRVKDIDHTSPVEGPARTFERKNEGRPARTDGGHRRERRAGTTERPETNERADSTEKPERNERVDSTERPETNDQADTTGSPSSAEGRPRRRVKDIDHTSPVDGHVRVFGRGCGTDDEST